MLDCSILALDDSPRKHAPHLVTVWPCREPTGLVGRIIDQGNMVDVADLLRLSRAHLTHVQPACNMIAVAVDATANAALGPAILYSTADKYLRREQRVFEVMEKSVYLTKRLIRQ